MSRAESQAHTRALLIARGRQTFVKKGFNAATVEEISERAGFSRGAFYANFADKADLFLTILEQERERDFARLARDLDAVPDGQILARLGEWMMRVLVNGPLQRASAEFHLAVHGNPRLRRRIAENVRAIRRVNASMVARYRQRHGITLAVDDETFATIATATIGGFADQLRVDPEFATQETIALALTVLWNGVQPSGTGSSW